MFRRTKPSLYQPRPEPSVAGSKVGIEAGQPPSDLRHRAKIIPFPQRIDVPGPAKASQPSEAGIR